MGTPNRKRSPAEQRIIDRVAKLSKPYGTTIAFDGGVGRVRI